MPTKPSTHFSKTLNIVFIGYIPDSLALDIPSGGDFGLVCSGKVRSVGCLISTPFNDGLDILIGCAVDTHPSVSVETTHIQHIRAQNSLENGS